MSPVLARALLGLSVLALANGTAAAKAPPTDRLGVVDTLIHEIQGSDLVSPMTGTRVTTQGVVTAVVADGYFLQSLPGDDDGDPATSEGLFIFTGAADPAVQVGQQREVEGLAEEAVTGDSPHQLTLTRLADTQSLLIASGLPLPPPVSLNAGDLAPDADIAALERYEGMRVSVAQLVVTGPAGARIDPQTLGAESDGVVHAVEGTFIRATHRPFRKPGLSVLDAGTPPIGKSLAYHDANPQVLQVDSRAQTGAPLLDLGRNADLDNAVGVLGYSRARYSLLIDPVSPLVVRPGSSGEGAAGREHGEFKLVWMDLGELFDASDDPALGEPVPSPAAYQARLDKLADMLCDSLSNPEVIAVSGVENEQVLRDLAAVIDTNPTGYCAARRKYQAVVPEGLDPSGLDIGFLLAADLEDGLRQRVQLLSLSSFAQTETSDHPAGGSEPLFTTPPVVARLRITDVAGRTEDFTAVNVKFRELDGADSLAPGPDGWATEGDRIMTLRARQAASLASWLHGRQEADPGEAIAVLGGFDADHFNDGRVDVMGIVTGMPAPAHQSWVSLPSPVTRPLTNLTWLIPDYTRYNANAGGELRALDHIVLNEPMHGGFVVTTSSPRINADFPATQRVVAGARPFAARDPLVARVKVPTFIDADTRLGSMPERTVSTRRDNIFWVNISNLGPNPAQRLVLDVDSNLLPGQWNLSTEYSGWTCGAVQSQAGGSRGTCTTDSLVTNTMPAIHANVPAHPALAGNRATFTATLRGLHDDPDPSNNVTSGSLVFEDRPDLRLALTPIGGTGDLPPGTRASWLINVDANPLNPPGPMAIRVDVDAPANEVVFNLSDGRISCDGGTALAPRRSRFACSISNDAALPAVFSLSAGTGLGDGGRVISVEAEVSSASPDVTPDDNLANSSRRVSDAVNLSVRDPYLPPIVGVGETVIAVATIRHLAPGVARNARLEMLVDLPPEALGAVQPGTTDPRLANVWTCSPPEAAGTGARVLCTAPEILPVQVPGFTSWIIRLPLSPAYRPGLANFPVNVQFNLSSDSEEMDPADNSVAGAFTVDQTADVRSFVTPPEYAVAEPNRAEFSVSLSVSGRNVPRDLRARLAFSGDVPLDAIRVSRPFSQQPLACTQVVATPGGPALECPVESGYPFLTVSAPTRPDMVGTTLVLRATASHELTDSSPGNNDASAGIAVIAESDLCLGVFCSVALPPYPTQLGGGGPNTIRYAVGNLGPSIAPATVLTIEVATPPARLAARYDGQACASAVAIGGGLSRVQCPVGNLPPRGPVKYIDVDIDTTGVTSGNIAGSIALASDAIDPTTYNHRINFNLPVTPVVNLSADVAAKPASFPKPVDFVVTPGIDAANTNVRSELVITVRAPGRTAPIRLSGLSWNCATLFVTPSDTVTYECSHSLGNPPARTSRLVVSVPAGSFGQIGGEIEVSALHRYQQDAFAVDRNPGDDMSRASVVVDGRRTQSAASRPEPTPAYGTRRAITPTPLRPQVRAAARE